MGLLEKILGKKKLDYKKRFTLLKAAISGTMSEFYMARDKETDQIVGLKILDKEKTRQIDERFRNMKGVRKPREGQIAIQLKHPYIVDTFEEGFTTGNEQYLVMEYLEGTGLNNVLMIKQDYLAGARLTYIRQCAEALQAVHKAGFIHRDFCPRNLLFTGDGKILKLTDFGLSLPNRPPFTDPGNRTGTPNYMAPELIRRRATDERLDIFAFGVTMYELCTRELPWPRGANGLAAMTHDQPPAPITNYRPNINPTLAKAIHWCLKAEPRDRCPSMADFLKMIERVEYEDDV
ncbi:MAG: serine/threonine protein kinase [Thermoguttaceae bacterium]|nr:serine/threonine protein kinase [Thermoguttaceae bacterium]